jgi:hypothetical protein
MEDGNRQNERRTTKGEEAEELAAETQRMTSKAQEEPVGGA